MEWNGTIYDILRIDGQTNTTYNKAAVLRWDQNKKQPQLQPHDQRGAGFVFDRMIDFPATSSKFVIRKV